MKLIAYKKYVDSGLIFYKENPEWVWVHYEIEPLERDAYEAEGFVVCTPEQFSDYTDAYAPEYQLFLSLREPMKFRLTGDSVEPCDIDYDVFTDSTKPHGKLVKERIFRKEGRLSRVNYYWDYLRDSNGNPRKNMATGDLIFDPTQLVVAEHREYLIHPISRLVIKRTMTINWFYENGTIGATRVTEKHYSDIDAVLEAVTRRQNIWDDVKNFMLRTMLMNGVSEPRIIQIMENASIDNKVSLYVEGAIDPLIRWTDNFICPELDIVLRGDGRSIRTIVLAKLVGTKVA